MQPALLGRLTDHEPSARLKTDARGVLSLEQFRAAVLHDIGHLFNTTCAVGAPGVHSESPAAHSVLGYGMRDLVGRTLSPAAAHAIAKALAACIKCYEPRIAGDSLSVTPVTDRNGLGGCTLVFLVSGELWWQPRPARFSFRTEFDLDAGTTHVIEA